jgi:pyruvate kinase
MFAGVDLTGKVLPLHLISLGVEASLEYLKPAAVFVCTDDGGSARRLASFRLPVWIVAVSADIRTCQNLLFSYGVIPSPNPLPVRPGEGSKGEGFDAFDSAVRPSLFRDGFVTEWVRRHNLPGAFAILTQQPTANNPESHHRMEIINL